MWQKDQLEGMMPELYKWDFPVSSLKAMEDCHFRYLIVASRFLNQSNLIHNQLICFSDLETLNGAEASAKFFQVTRLTYHQAGIVSEAWKRLRKRSADIQSTYKKHIELALPESLVSLSDLNNNHEEYFGSESLLSLLRNKYAFHFDDFSRDLKSSLDDFEDDKTLHAYVSNDLGSSLFHFAEELVLMRLLKAREKELVARGELKDEGPKVYLESERMMLLLKSIWSEVDRIAGLVTDVANALILGTISEHFPENDFGEARIIPEPEMPRSAIEPRASFPYFLHGDYRKRIAPEVHESAGPMNPKRIVD